MKKTFLFLATCLLFGLLLGLFSCKPKLVMPEFDVVVVDTTVVRHGVPGKFQYAFTLISNADKSPVLTAIQEANIDHFFGPSGASTMDVRQAIARSIEQFMSGIDELDSLSRDAIPEMILTAESEAHVVDSLLVYTITTSDYTGGAHGMYGFFSHNYSLKGGYELVLADLFDAKEQESLLTLIRHKLYDQFHVAGDEGLVNLGFFPDQIGVVENFEVTDDGITFYYNPYDIAAFAVGDVSVHISTEELEKL